MSYRLLGRAFPQQRLVSFKITDCEPYEQIHYAGQYLSTKEVQQQFAKAIFKKKFRAEHSKELDAYTQRNCG